MTAPAVLLSPTQDGTHRFVQRVMLCVPPAGHSLRSCVGYQVDCAASQGLCLRRPCLLNNGPQRRSGDADHPDVPKRGWKGLP